MSNYIWSAAFLKLCTSVVLTMKRSQSTDITVVWFLTTAAVLSFYLLGPSVL